VCNSFLVAGPPVAKLSSIFSAIASISART
jgi:hypothetical protein